jgi:hypothetical protein
MPIASTLRATLSIACAAPENLQELDVLSDRRRSPRVWGRILQEHRVPAGSREAFTLEREGGTGFAIVANRPPEIPLRFD